MFCSKCGREADDNSVFCPSCGNKIVPYIEQSNLTRQKKRFSWAKAGAIINIAGFSLAILFYAYLLSINFTPPTAATLKFWRFAYILPPLWICAISIFIMRKENQKLIKVLSVVNIVLTVIGGVISIMSVGSIQNTFSVCCLGTFFIIPTILQIVGSLISLIGAFTYEKAD